VLNLRQSYNKISYQDNWEIKFKHFYYACKLDKIILPKVRLSLLFTRRCQFLSVRRERSKNVRQWSNYSETKTSKLSPCHTDQHRSVPHGLSGNRTPISDMGGQFAKTFKLSPCHTDQHRSVPHVLSGKRTPISDMGGQFAKTFKTNNCNMTCVSRVVVILKPTDWSQVLLRPASCSVAVKFITIASETDAPLCYCQTCKNYDKTFWYTQ